MTIHFEDPNLLDVVGSILAIIVSLGGVWALIEKARGPGKKHRAEHEDFRMRIEALERSDRDQRKGNRVNQKALLAILRHLQKEDDDKADKADLKEAENEMQDYLLDTKE